MYKYNQIGKYWIVTGNKSDGAGVGYKLNKETERENESWVRENENWVEREMMSEMREKERVREKEEEGEGK